MENVSSIAFTITYVATANAPSELLANSGPYAASNFDGISVFASFGVFDPLS